MKKWLPKKSELIIGVLFILAAVTAIIGHNLYNPILKSPDYLIKGPEYTNQVIMGALMELILVVSAVGTSTTMFPILIELDKNNQDCETLYLNKIGDLVEEQLFNFKARDNISVIPLK
jgi:hypothetical protein